MTHYDRVHAQII